MEKWKPIKDFETRYLVSSSGKIKSLRSGKLLKECIRGVSWRKEPCVMLFGETHKLRLSIGRIVALNFLKKGSKTEVNHKDKNPFNNHISNLEWVTRSENCLHRDMDKGKRGAYYRKDNKKWRAIIRQQGVNTNLGHYETKEEAHEAFRVEYIKRYKKEPW